MIKEIVQVKNYKQTYNYSNGESKHKKTRMLYTTHIRKDNEIPKKETIWNSRVKGMTLKY